MSFILLWVNWVQRGWFPRMTLAWQASWGTTRLGQPMWLTPASGTLADISGTLAQLRQLGLFLSIWPLHNLSNKVSGPLMHWGSQSITRAPRKHRSGKKLSGLPKACNWHIFYILLTKARHKSSQIQCGTGPKQGHEFGGGVIHWIHSESSYHTSLAASSHSKSSRYQNSYALLFLRFLSSSLCVSLIRVAALFCQPNTKDKWHSKWILSSNSLNYTLLTFI